MKVTGFTIIRNAVKYDFPIVEAICSALPLCDEFVVAIGNSDDDTIGLIKGIGSDKIRIEHTIWDDSLREGGTVLARETDKAFAMISPDTDWCLYLQADEIIHEADHDKIRAAMQRHKDDKRIDGLIFDYLHFHGSYRHISIDPSNFKSEVRIIRNNKAIYSYLDAQGFRKGDSVKLDVAHTGARIFHYSKVKDPALMQKKHVECSRYWYTDDYIADNLTGKDEYDFADCLLSIFKGTHPAVMAPRIARATWVFEHNPSDNKFSLKKRLKIFVEKLGFNVSYQNYHKIA